MANRFVSFLEKFGVMVLQGMNLIPQVTTVLESSAGQPIPVLDKLSQIAALVKQAEVMISGVLGAGSGPQKAKAIAPLVAQIVMSSELVAGKKIPPEKMAAFNAACLRIGSDVADILNCLDSDVAEVPTERASPTPSPVAVISPAKPLAVPNAMLPNAGLVAAPDPVAVQQAIEAEIPAAPGVAAAIAQGLHTLPQE